MSDCVIISGTLEAKLRNKLFAYFHQRYVELVYVGDTHQKNGYYELRLYKNKKKSASSLYSLPLHPISMTCYINYLNSNKHQFTFICSSQRTSICFSAHTKYERDAWISVLEQLQWQFQPYHDAPMKPSHSYGHHGHYHQQQEVSQSNTTYSRSHENSIKPPISDYNESSDDSDELQDAYYYHQHQQQQQDKPTKHSNVDQQNNVSYIISLTQKNKNNDNNYFYNYYNSNLWNENKSSSHNYQQCTCHNCRGQKFTILGLLNDDYTQSQHDGNHVNNLDHLQHHTQTV